MKSRTFFTAIALIAGFIFVAGIAGFWGLTAQNPRALLARGGQEVPTAAQFVPRQAPAMVSLLARPDRLWQLRQIFTSPGERFQARQEWQSLQTTVTDAFGWDYDADVRPWLDQELTIAVTSDDLDHDDSNGQQTGYLVVLSCRDGQKAREAIHLLWQKRAISGKKLVFETISGIPLIYDQKSITTTFENVNRPTLTSIALESLASAVIGDRYVLLANHPQVLRQAIATFQAPDVSLARESSYRAALQSLSPNRIGWLYANAPTLLSWLGLEDADSLPMAGLDGRRAHHIFVSFRATESGLLGDVALAAAPGTVFETTHATLQQPAQVLGLMPEVTRFVISGNDLAHFLSETATNIKGYPVVQRSLDTFWASLPLPTDTVSVTLWDSIQGEYALGMLADTTPSWLLAAQVNTIDPFNSIDDLAQQQGLNISHVSLGDQDIIAWTKLSLVLSNPEGLASLNTQVVGVHTQINGYEVFSTSLSGLQQVLRIDENHPSLMAQPTFAQLADRVNSPYNSLVYIDWPHLAPNLRNRFPWLRLIEQAGQPLTVHLGPIFTAGQNSNSSLQEGVIAINLVNNLKDFQSMN
ncbi:MAG: DUF3352 domain-containing protein [Cyanobacteria bacterium P01_F01_bin.86]